MKNELNTIVAIATCISRFKKITSIGINRELPPIPIIEATKPIEIAVIKIKNKISGSMVETEK